MKKLLLFSLLILPFTLFAKIWIVDSNPGSVSKDFVNLQEAHDGASAGDTLYLIGSGVSYITEKVTINKRLIIIGPGYFLNNPETQVSLNPAYMRLASGACGNGIEFIAGSEGSALLGTTQYGAILINTNNIMIKRNHFINNGLNCGNAGRIDIRASSVYIVQNYINANTFSINLVIATGNSNIFIRNNYIDILGTVDAISSASGSALEITNNVIGGRISVSNALIKNNIFTSTAQPLVLSNCITRNNISVIANVLPAGENNTNSIPQANIFIGTGTLDGQWKLKDGSPAIGSGYEGVDMGMFGGDEPYVLSGIPPIPTIYQLNAPAVGEKNTGLPITIKAKSNN